MLSSSRSSTKRFVSQSLYQRRFYAAPTDGAFPPSKVKYIPTSGTYPKGFLAASAHAGVKPSNTKFDDLALIASETPCAAAGVFTRNVFKAAPVQVSRYILSRSRGDGIRSVVVNSGCANAVTGSGGLEDAVSMARKTDEMFAATPEAEAATPPAAATTDNLSGEEAAPLKSLVMSTGVIGQRLPIDKITSKIPTLHGNLGNTHDHWLRTARAICTTDTFPKLLSRTFTLPSHPETTYNIAGMTKGAGMIHPNMATLLSIITTDCAVTPIALRYLLQASTSKSFNCISIDGDTSTNDTCVLLANGAGAPPPDQVQPITVDIPKEMQPLPRPAKREPIATPASDSQPESQQRNKTVPPPRVLGSLLAAQSEDYRAFHDVLESFMIDLAKLIVRDGEGATKFVTVRVEGASTNAAAKRIAESIVRSPLVKTALYGKDANWGRILCAVGYAPGLNKVHPTQTSVSFLPADGSKELPLLVRGEPESVDEDRAKAILEMEDLEIVVRLNDGQQNGRPQFGKATMWTCDFSHEYVTINGDYRT